MKKRKKAEGFGRFLTYKNDFESQNCAAFDLQFKNDRYAKNIFMAIFVVLWPFINH